MQFSPDNRLLACEDQYKGIHLLNLETRQETALLPAGWNLIYPIGFAFAPQERSLAHCPDRSGVILLGDIASATNRSSLRGHTDMVTALAFSPDGRRLASGSMDRTLRLWDMRRRAETLTLTNQAKMIWSLVFSPDGQTLAVVDDTEQVKLLDAATGAVRNELRGHLDLVFGVAFLPESQSVITGSADGTVRVWDTAPRARPKQSQPLPEGIFITHTHSHAYALSPDGQHLLTVFTNGTFSIWNTRTFSESPRYRLPVTNIVSDMMQEAIGPRGTLAAFAVQANASNIWEFVVWDVSAGRARFSRQFEFPKGADFRARPL